MEKLRKKELENKAKAFLNFLYEIKKFKKKLKLIFHSDVDGFCSCFLMQNFLKEINIKFNPYPYDHEKRCKIKRNMPILALDISASKSSGFYWKGMEKSKSIFFIDHHFYTKEERKIFNKILITPTSSFLDAFYPCSKFCYDIISFARRFLKIDKEKGKDADELLIAFLGVVGDLTYRTKEFFPMLTKNIEKKYNIEWKSLLRIKRLLDFAIKKEQASSIFSYLNLLYSKKIEEVRESLEKKYRGDLERVDRLVKNFEKKKKRYGRFYVYRIKEKASRIATEIINRLNYKNVVVIKKEKSYFSISIRSRNLNLLEVVDKIFDGCKATYGGHKTAVGALVKAKDLGRFLENLKKI